MEETLQLAKDLLLYLWICSTLVDKFCSLQALRWKKNKCRECKCKCYAWQKHASFICSSEDCRVADSGVGAFLWVLRNIKKTSWRLLLKNELLLPKTGNLLKKSGWNKQLPLATSVQMKMPSTVFHKINNYYWLLLLKWRCLQLYFIK